MSTLLVTLYRLNDAVYTPIDLPYTSIMSLPANDVALVELLLPYARLACLLVAAVVFMLRKAPKQPTPFHTLYIHRTREHHMNRVKYDADKDPNSACPVCQQPYKPAESTVAVLACGHCYHPTCLSSWLDEHRSCAECGAAVAEQLVWPIDSWSYAASYWLRSYVLSRQWWLDALFVLVSAALLLLELLLCVVGEGSVTALLLEGLTLRHAYLLCFPHRG